MRKAASGGDEGRREDERSCGGAPANGPVALKDDRPEGHYSWVAKTSEIAPHEGE